MSIVGRSPLALCYGTRPQVIKASVLIELLDERWDLLTVDTGQHYDYQLNALLYEQLGVREPAFFLEVGSGDHAEQTAAVLIRSAEIMARHRPRAVIVIGDTNSTLGCALAAAKLRIPVVHVEAGLRSGDLMMAEEINRRVVDSISSVLCAPSAAAEETLHAERAPGLIARTGDIARDVLMRSLMQVPGGWREEVLPGEAEGPFVFATLHRAEITADPERLAGVVAALGELDVPVIFPAHPRTRAILAKHGILERLPREVRLLEPLGYLQTLACVRDAQVVVTDSGGVQREAYWLGTPCITVRQETEWTETVELGANTLLAPSRAPEALSSLVSEQAARKRRGEGWDRNAYGQGDAAKRIRDAVERWSARQPA